MVAEGAIGKTNSRSRSRDQGLLRLASPARRRNKVTWFRVDRPRPARRGRNSLGIDGGQKSVELPIRPGHARSRFEASAIRIESQGSFTTSPALQSIPTHVSRGQRVCGAPDPANPRRTVNAASRNAYVFSVWVGPSAGAINRHVSRGNAGL